MTERAMEFIDALRKVTSKFNYYVDTKLWDTDNDSNFIHLRVRHDGVVKRIGYPGRMPLQAREGSSFKAGAFELEEFGDDKIKLPNIRLKDELPDKPAE